MKTITLLKPSGQIIVPKKINTTMFHSKINNLDFHSVAAIHRNNVRDSVLHDNTTGVQQDNVVPPLEYL